MIYSIRTYVAGAKDAGRHVRTALFVYGVNLVLALLVGLPLVGRLQEDFRGSMLPETLLKGFDYTAFTEMLRNSSETIATVFAQAKWVVLIYFGLSIFIAAGILHLIDQKEKFSLRSFFDGARLYLFRFIRLFVYMAVLHLVAAFLVYLPLTMKLESATETMHSESGIFFLVLAGLALHLFLIAILLMTSLYAKAAIVKDKDRRVLRSAFRSIGFVFKRIPATFSLFLLLFFSMSLLSAGLFLLSENMRSATGAAILSIFVVQQLLVFARVLGRIWVLAGHYRLYERYAGESRNLGKRET